MPRAPSSARAIRRPAASSDAVSAMCGARLSTQDSSSRSWPSIDASWMYNHEDLPACRSRCDQRVNSATNCSPWTASRSSAVTNARSAPAVQYGCSIFVRIAVASCWRGPSGDNVVRSSDQLKEDVRSPRIALVLSSADSFASSSRMVKFDSALDSSWCAAWRPAQSRRFGRVRGVIIETGSTQHTGDVMTPRTRSIAQQLRSGSRRCIGAGALRSHPA